ILLEPSSRVFIVGILVLVANGGQVLHVFPAAGKLKIMSGLWRPGLQCFFVPVGIGIIPRIISCPVFFYILWAVRCYSFLSVRAGIHPCASIGVVGCLPFRYGQFINA